VARGVAGSGVDVAVDLHEREDDEEAILNLSA
jgi:hypothetical protein